MTSAEQTGTVKSLARIFVSNLVGKFDPTQPVPSITLQTEWPCKLIDFPNRQLVQYFNPSLIQWNGRRYLVTRRRRIKFNPGRNDITLWDMSNDDRVGREHPVRFSGPHPRQHWEDPRALLTKDGRFLLSYATFLSPWSNNQVHIAAAWINQAFSASVFNPVYGQNGKDVKSNTGHEKNWLWFEPLQGQFHFVYRTDTEHVVVKYGNGPEAEHKALGPTWDYGIIRGGSTPVLFDGLYWSFFHSSLDISEVAPRRRYYMGAYAFDSQPPFTPVFQTKRPILAGSEEDPREPSAPYCVFPCGALMLGASSVTPTWMVSLGVNDCRCAIIRIPHADLMMRMEPIE